MIRRYEHRGLTFVVTPGDDGDISVTYPSGYEMDNTSWYPMAAIEADYGQFIRCTSWVANDFADTISETWRMHKAEG